MSDETPHEYVSNMASREPCCSICGEDDWHKNHKAKFTRSELTDAVKAAIAKPSPCGQKFSDGTPHPASLWREGAHTPHEGDSVHRCQADCLPGYCLICQSEEKLREEIASLKTKDK